MPAYNFQEQFAPAVVFGEKRQTIRKPRKRPTRRGDKLYLYTGMRTKQCRRLLNPTPCTAVVPVVIERDSITLRCTHYTASWWLEAFAKDDGFESWAEMRAWFEETHGLPFNGEIVQW